MLQKISLFKFRKYLKTKLKKENNQLVSVTNQLKLLAADGKKYNTDMLDSENIIEIPILYPKTLIISLTSLIIWMANG